MPDTITYAHRIATRASVVEACKADMECAKARYRLKGNEPSFYGELIPMRRHERAAITVLNCWGHVHPKEHRLRARIMTLRAQRAAGWSTAGTEADIKDIWQQRRTSLHAFWAAVSAYSDAKGG